MLEMTVNRGSGSRSIVKWTGLFIWWAFFVSAMLTFHQQQLQKLKVDSELLSQKSFLVSQMHDEMLLISRLQLQILHASNHQQVKEKLMRLSDLVSDHLFHYHQLKSIADDSDVDLLNKFKLGFEKWRDFNEDLLIYANSVSDSGFINILNKVDMAISQLDEGETLHLASQLNLSDSKIN